MNSSKLNQTKHVKERKPLSQSQSTTHKYIIFCHQMFCSRFPAMPTSYTFLTSCYPQIRKRAIEKERVRGHGTHEKRERIEQNRMTASTAYTYRLERLIEEHEGMQRDADDIVNALFDAALYAKESQDNGELAKLKKALKKILNKQNHVKVRAHGLRELRERGASIEEVVNYVENTAKDTGNTYYNLEQHSEKWREFLTNIEGDTSGGAQALDEDDDEDLAVVPTQHPGQGFAPNRHCPLTGIDIMDLKDPVKDTKGYIYEKDALAKYLKIDIKTGKGLRSRSDLVPGRRKCPVAGSNHEVVWSQLQSATMQIKLALRQERIRQTQNPTQQDNTILDL